ncbi:MAG TPA: MFS transporter [Candidatus Limnocylindria bacterium]|nr:MFS transporter [Candidatus Limnocylindria bacterium]
MATEQASPRAETASAATVGGGLILATLAAGQFLMTLDSSVMNVSIATVAEDVGTTVTGIQTAITLYTLVMASLMIVGSKVGAVIGHRRAFSLGLIVYGFGSGITAIAPSLPVLLFGWSLLEGIGAALILPAIVSLVAANVAPTGRSAAYGLIAAAGACAVAVGPLIGGALTTYASWRWVFAGEVVVVLIILVVSRRIADAPPASRPKIDGIGAVLSAAGLGMLVFGVLRAGDWGLIQPNTGAPILFGTSLAIWLIIGGFLVLWLFLLWQVHLERTGAEPLVPPSILRVAQLRGGLTLFGFQFFLQAGIFFTIPLFLSIVLELSAIETGVRLVPLSLSLLATALGIPRVFPSASPRRVSRIGLLLMSGGTAVFVGGLDPGADASIVLVPMLLIGGGIGALASQLGAVTVSSVPDERSAEVGGLQNTATNLGASLGTALIGSILFAVLASSMLEGVIANPDIPTSVKESATVQLSAGVPFVSNTQLETALDAAGVPPDVADSAIEINTAARLDGLRTALAAVVLIGILGLFFTGRIPSTPIGHEDPAARPEDGVDEGMLA